MKIIAKPIDMLSVSYESKIPDPIRFRIKKKDSEEKVVIKVKVNSVEERKMNGRNTLIYRCQGVVNGVLRPYELKYKKDSCTWELYKM